MVAHLRTSIKTEDRSSTGVTLRNVSLIERHQCREGHGTFLRSSAGNKYINIFMTEYPPSVQLVSAQHNIISPRCHR